MADLEERTLDRYQLKKLMGSGGMADVYVAFDPRFQRRVAVKVFKREDEALLRRFIREARLMASLSHPHLMPVFDTGDSRLAGGNVYYIVMPLMEGGTLRSLIKEHGALSLGQCCRYVREVASALDYVHAHGVIHRDIKSSNVLLDQEGRSYLADFGIAHADTESTQLTTSGNVLGTVGYIAPELFMGAQADKLSDIYALGVLLYEMVTGHQPFTAETPIAVITMQISDPPPSPRQYVSGLPSQVEQVLFRALEKQSGQRYQSAADLAEAFCRAVEESPEIDSDATDVITEKRRAVLSEVKTSLLPQDRVPKTRPAATQPEVAQPAVVRPSTTRPGVYAASTQPAVQSPATQTQQTAYQADGGQYQRMQPPSPPPAPPPPATSPRRSDTDSRSGSGSASRQNGLVALIIVTVLVVIGAAVLVTVERPRSQSAISTPTATDQAQNATVLPAQATRAARAHATATAAVFAHAAAGTLLYSDPLTDGKSQNVKNEQWDNSSACTFTSNGYTITTSSGQSCHERAKQYGDFAMQVDMTIKKADFGAILIRMSDSGGYVFEVDNNGYYRVCVDIGSTSTLDQLDGGSSPALKTGSATNRLQVIARNNVLFFYANGVYLTAIADSHFTTGELRLFAYPKSGEKATVIFRNISIYALA